METHSTSEEKLLKLIRKNPGKKTNNDKIRKKEREKDFLDELEEKRVSKGSDLLSVVNSLLYVLIFLFLVFWGYDFYYRKDTKEYVFPETLPMTFNKTVSLDKIPDTEKDFGYYEGILSGYDLFEHPWEKETEQPKTEEQETSPLSDQLKIVGIVLDQRPQVILKNLKTQETFFVYENEKILDAVVKEIKEDKVLFLYNGNIVELGQ